MLKRALEEVEHILSPEEQNMLAQWLVAEIEGGAEVARRFPFNDPRSPRLLERLAARALEEARAGNAKDIDPDAL